jgi:superfamily I DNA and/or RNA helicase
MHPQTERLLQCVELEEKEQANRYRLDQQHNLRQLKAEGFALHPLIIIRKSFGYADYPELSFKLTFPQESNLFKDGSAIELFKIEEESVKGILLSLEGIKGEIRLLAPDFPDWTEDDGVGIKLAPDTRTTGIMKKVIHEIECDKKLFDLFCQLHETKKQQTPVIKRERKVPTITYRNDKLNKSQQLAVNAILENEELTIVHGPPGTGKTTTLTESIFQLVQKGEKVLVSAPSNTAVDNISKSLIKLNIPLLRVGNTGKINNEIFPYTPEGKMNNSKAQKEIKQLRVRAEEFRRMALKYKRSFGKAEREQRNLLFAEVKNIRNEIKKLQAYHEEKWMDEAAVIAGTPIGLYDARLKNYKFSTLVIDEAGQCIEPLAWCIFSLAEKYVLAGDHWQLPPTVISNEAATMGLNNSILEIAVANSQNVHLLNTQYRMRKTIAGFSSAYFYDSLLHTAENLHDTGTHLTFIDTAGSGYEEKPGADGVSLQNDGELNIVQQILSREFTDPSKIAFISPYAGQVAAAKEVLPATVRSSTIDSFQGQENEIIIVSLVRSNDDGEIGFLKDYRRLNVAITRAKEQLIVIGDSATIGKDKFYREFLEYTELHGNYRTVWEYDL